jgi:hypothetical protein
MAKLGFKVLLLSFCVSSTAHALKVTPIAHLNVMGGLYNSGDTHSSGINVDGSIVPVIGINSRLYLIPIYIGSYHETQSVYNFLGQNILINRQLDQTGVLRAAWALNSSWRLKPRVGFTKEWIEQTTDESLSNGLFNFQRAFTGLSAERVFGNGSLEVGYEYGSIKYPHYQALDADPRLTTTGITSSVGTDVLDFHAHDASVIYDQSTSDKRWHLLSTFDWIRENFVDQKVLTVSENGLDQEVGDTQRTDDIFNLALQQLYVPTSRWSFNFGETFQYYFSNQNAFDATQLFYTSRYYNFFDVQLNPSATMTFDDARWDATLGLTYGFRQYSHRRTQDGSGAYMDSLIYSMDRGAVFTLRSDLGRITSRRWLKGIHGVLTSNILTYWSNTRYEANYPYNYTVYNFLLGLSWDF